MGVLIAIRRALGGRVSFSDPRDDAGGPPPASAADQEFARLVAGCLDELPEEFLAALEHVPVVVSDEGSVHGAYGLYHGAGVAHADIPAQILIFRDTLTRDFGHDPVLLRAEIRRTVRHELAHHLGYGEAGVAALRL